MKNEEVLELIKLVAPGTYLREGLDNILKAKTGGILVCGESEDIMKLVDGGFIINQTFTPLNVYELAKMDGAILLSEDTKKILRANTQLVPDSKIRTFETGTRHRTAERVAKQTNKLVICISQRRSIITIFKGDFRYVLNDTATILTRANQALETLEKYKIVLDNMLNVLGELEFDDIVSLETVATTIFRLEMVIRMSQEVERNIVELGDEGRLVQMQLDELMTDVEDEETYLLQDYALEKSTKNKHRKIDNILSDIRKLDKNDLMNYEKIIKILGYEMDGNSTLDLNVSPRGYRILNKIPKMPIAIIENLVDAYSSLQGICRATIDELDDVEGIGEARAKAINQALRRLQEQYLLKGFRV